MKCVDGKIRDILSVNGKDFVWNGMGYFALDKDFNWHIFQPRIIDLKTNLRGN